MESKFERNFKILMSTYKQMGLCRWNTNGEITSPTVEENAKARIIKAMVSKTKQSTTSSPRFDNLYFKGDNDVLGIIDGEYMLGTKNANVISYIIAGPDYEPRNMGSGIWEFRAYIENKSWGIHFTGNIALTEQDGVLRRVY